MSRLGTAQVGSGQLGATGTPVTISFDSASTSAESFVLSANRQFEIGFSESSTSQYTADINAVLALESSINALSSLNNSITGTFTLSLKPEDTNLGGGRLGSERVGDTLEGFASSATSTFGINAIFSIDTASASQSAILQDLTRVLPITQASASASTASFETIRVRILDFESESITEFDWVLSEDSYEELYGETLGSAEKQLIIFGSAQID